jgi:hypothetical protein
MSKFDDDGKVLVQGHVLITDTETGEEILNKRNAIHQENMSVALAKSLANKPDGPIYTMFFGNGGSSVNGLGVVTYLPPNVQGVNANLYNPTYFEIVDPTPPGPPDNSMTVNHVRNALFSDIVITATLGFGEPQGQSSFDDATDTEQQFVFDEIGLKGFDTDPNMGPLLTHVIFNPIQKSLNRSIKVTYTLRIQMC